MKMLSDSELNNIFAQRLADMEVDVPADSEALVWGALVSANTVLQTTASKILYGAMALLLLMPLAYHELRNAGQNSTLALEPIKMSTSPAAIAEPAVADAPSTPPKRAIRAALALVDQSIDRSTRESLRHHDRNTVSKAIVPAVDKQTSVGITADTFVANEPVPVATAELRASIIASDSTAQTIPSDSIARETNAETIPTMAVPQTKTQRAIWLAFSAQPFLNYKNITPLHDGFYLSHFTMPSAFTAQRVGLKLMASAEYEVRSNTFMSLGVSYFSYHSGFSYQANELGNGILTNNTVDDHLHGVSLSWAIRYPILTGLHRNQYVRVGIDALRTAGSLYHQPDQFMLNLGYANHWPVGKGELRLTPMISYGLTQLRYPGLDMRSYWVGIEFGYGLNVSKRIVKR